MMDINVEEIKKELAQGIEGKFAEDNWELWNQQISKLSEYTFLPLQFVKSNIEYQNLYFDSIRDNYHDFSMIIHRGGRPVGILSLCMWTEKTAMKFGSCGGQLMGPVFSDLQKAEGKRNVIEKILNTLFFILNKYNSSILFCQDSSMEFGASQWTKKLMEHGAKTTSIGWSAFVDLSLSTDEIQKRIRRTNKYSVRGEKSEYDIEICDNKSKDIDKTFYEFRQLHYICAGRSTRPESTWNKQLDYIKVESDENGRKFIVAIRDKKTHEMAGAALFTVYRGGAFYDVAAYDRTRFAKPVGHIVQAVAIEYLKNHNLRWYEIGSRSYPYNVNYSNQKLVDIGLYKEGFATNLFPTISFSLDKNDFDNIYNTN